MSAFCLFCFTMDVNAYLWTFRQVVAILSASGSTGTTAYICKWCDQNQLINTVLYGVLFLHELLMVSRFVRTGSHVTHANLSGHTQLS